MYIYIYIYVYIYTYKSLKRHLLFLFCYISECLLIPSSDSARFLKYVWPFFNIMQ